MLKNKKFFIFILLFIIIVISPFFYLHSFSKYTIENAFIAANLNIDTKKPNIELISIDNTNQGYKQYANKTHTITARIKVIEKNIAINNINENNVKILVNGNLCNPTFKDIKLISEARNEKVYDIVITNVLGNR